MRLLLGLLFLMNVIVSCKTTYSRDESLPQGSIDWSQCNDQCGEHIINPRIAGCVTRCELWSSPPPHQNEQHSKATPLCKVSYETRKLPGGIESSHYMAFVFRFQEGSNFGSMVIDTGFEQDQRHLDFNKTEDRRIFSRESVGSHSMILIQKSLQKVRPNSGPSSGTQEVLRPSLSVTETVGAMNKSLVMTMNYGAFDPIHPFASFDSVTYQERRGALLLREIRCQ